MTTIEHSMECLSRAVVQAIAGRAGLVSDFRDLDYGLDGSFRNVARRGNRLVETGFPLDFQLKSTTNWNVVDDHIVYDLAVKNYNDLVARLEEEVGAVLILLCLPKDDAQWLSVDHDKLELRHCCYWHKIEGEPTNNAATKVVHIPKANLLTVQALQQLMTLERARRLGEI